MADAVAETFEQFRGWNAYRLWALQFGAAVGRVMAVYASDCRRQRRR